MCRAFPVIMDILIFVGYHGSNQDADFLKSKADEMGYPVLIKAIKGGGGKVPLPAIY